MRPAIEAGFMQSAEAAKTYMRQLQEFRDAYRRKWKAPGSCWGTPGPHCKQPVSRILSRTAIPLGLPLLTGSSNLPGGFRSPPACAAEDDPRWRAEPARMRDGSGRAAHFLPIWSCSVWGLPCLRRYRLSGALLPHLFTLTFASCEARAVCSLWHWPSRGLDAAIPDVIRHTALRSSDFPLPAALARHRQRPPGLPAVLMIPQCCGGLLPPSRIPQPPEDQGLFFEFFATFFEATKVA